MTDHREDQIIAVARQYVVENFDESVDNYSLTYDGFDGQVHRVLVEHRDDLDPDRPVAPGAGSGKSRTVLVDPTTMAVTASLRWQ